MNNRILESIEAKKINCRYDVYRNLVVATKGFYLGIENNPNLLEYLDDFLDYKLEKWNINRVIENHFLNEISRIALTSIVCDRLIELGFDINEEKISDKVKKETTLTPLDEKTAKEIILKFV